jgi:integrase
MAKLTKEFVEEIEAPVTGQRIYRDEDVLGLGVRVTMKSKSYIFEKRIGGNNRRVTIAKCSEMSLECAKKQACIMLGEIAKGNDPRTGRRINTLNDITLREVLQKFLEIKPIRKATKRNYSSAINRHLEDWLDMPITAISKDMIEQRHRELTDRPNRLKTSGHGRANKTMKMLRALINFASDRFGTEDEPLIKSNPVDRLSQNGSWHRIHPRQRIIPDHKLKVWYQAVRALKSEVTHDLLIFLLLTGMRIGETKKLKWSFVDFENEILVVPRELTKSDREHRLPLSDFLMKLLKKRHVYREINSDWVFQSSRLRNKHISGNAAIVSRVSAVSGVNFSYHDLRRTFLTMGEKLDVPHYILKRLVNHSVSNDITGGYLVLDIERLRSQMSRITSAFLDLLEIDCSETKKWMPVRESNFTEAIQLSIPFEDFRNM